jgi:Zn-dependent peptidase ImmA (M78 family)
MSTLHVKITEKVMQLLSMNKVLRPPVPVDRIAEKLGIELKFAPSDDELSGALIRTGNETVIGVNSSHHQNRQRFTIAHELGHFLLHKGIQMHVDEDFRVNLRDGQSSRATSQEEIEANRFAAELLMPTEFIRRDVERRNSRNGDLVEELALRYGVSPRAMEIRLTNLGVTSPV